MNPKKIERPAGIDTASVLKERANDPELQKLIADFVSISNPELRLKIRLLVKEIAAKQSDDAT